MPLLTPNRTIKIVVSGHSPCILLVVQKDYSALNLVHLLRPCWLLKQFWKHLHWSFLCILDWDRKMTCFTFSRDCTWLHGIDFDFKSCCSLVCIERSFWFAVGAASERKNFDEESNASLSTARDETRDCFSVDDVEPSASQMFSERSLFSFWPKVSQTNPFQSFASLFVNFFFFFYASSFSFLLPYNNSVCHKSYLKINEAKLESLRKTTMWWKKCTCSFRASSFFIIEQNFIIRSLGHETRAEMEKMRYPLCTLQFIMHAYTRTRSLTLVLLFCVCTSGQGNDQSYGQHLWSGHEGQVAFQQEAVLWLPRPVAWLQLHDNGQPPAEAESWWSLNGGSDQL